MFRVKFFIGISGYQYGDKELLQRLLIIILKPVIHFDPFPGKSAAFGSETNRFWQWNGVIVPAAWDIAQ